VKTGENSCYFPGQGQLRSRDITCGAWFGWSRWMRSSRSASLWKWRLRSSTSSRQL